MRIQTEKPVGHQEVNLHELERRVAVVEKELAAMAIASRGGVTKNPSVEGNEVPGPKLAKVVPYRTINEDGYCEGDRVKVRRDRDYWTKRRKPTEGQSGTIYAVTKKMVRLEIDGTKERIGKYNDNVQLIAIGNGKTVVYKPQKYGKDWEVYERRSPTA